jgi:hypothetical protein
MSEVTVLFKIKEEPSKEKVDEELNWYDTIRQKMLVFHGGKLSFKYMEDDFLIKMGASERQRKGIKSTYRMLPVVEDLEVSNHFKMNKTTNQKEIENWFYSSDYINDVSLDSISDDSMVFEVPDNKEKDFREEIEEQGFILND